MEQEEHEEVFVFIDQRFVRNSYRMASFWLCPNTSNGRHLLEGKVAFHTVVSIHFLPNGSKGRKPMILKGRR